LGNLLNHMQRDACHCGPPPEQCVGDEEVLTQYGLIRAPFRNQPRIALELGLSVLRGRISLEDATRYVIQAKPAERDLMKARIRRTRAGVLREAGFAVVHTPGRRVRASVHCTVAWPDSDPLRTPQVPWPSEISERFGSCFNEYREVEPDES
jgi:hypothetical protein